MPPATRQSDAIVRPFGKPGSGVGFHHQNSKTSLEKKGENGKLPPSTCADGRVTSHQKHEDVQHRESKASKIARSASTYNTHMDVEPRRVAANARYTSTTFRKNGTRSYDDQGTSQVGTRSLSWLGTSRPAKWKRVTRALPTLHAQSDSAQDEILRIRRLSSEIICSLPPLPGKETFLFKAMLLGEQ